MATATALEVPVVLPDHLQLPEADGTFAQSFLELPQSMLLTDAIEPVLRQLHPDGRYALGQDCGIYWRATNPSERGVKVARLVLRAWSAAYARWTLPAILCALAGSDFPAAIVGVCLG